MTEEPKPETIKCESSEDEQEINLVTSIFNHEMQEGTPARIGQTVNVHRGDEIVSMTFTIRHRVLVDKLHDTLRIGFQRGMNARDKLAHDTRAEILDLARKIHKRVTGATHSEVLAEFSAEIQKRRAEEKSAKPGFGSTGADPIPGVNDDPPPGQADPPPGHPDAK